mmetsp:Transcript_34933/g.48447  ORF Transcript_34933/g.48447 Transcript_34933/m.48447 type:complete len:210 (-) Transcript_34933:404-1033(-)|eukprot:CAMPEP_0196570858 /NCGR_PEP_ID=MMETSP1081-20130531/1029_1 /TAXON_ID=36882 /ORGANISM="Pyramimonas amylifera, Strain CCMP720" /LENGTH=209 /DNA_ID=CAMNT_0041887539 /DNA_START=276 /DNA_END=905 /DNA_ORIENTATION=-
MSDDEGCWDDDDYEIPDVVKKPEPEPEVTKEEANDSKGKKNEKKKYREELDEDETLADPVAEKLRRQKLVEEADFELAKECFGEDAVDLDTFVPKTEKDFLQYAGLVVGKYMLQHERSAHYPSAMKQFLRKACSKMSAADVKELETSLGVLRNEKVKAEKPAKAGKKATKKASLNSGTGCRGGDDLLSMNEDAEYRDEVLDHGDYDDFM